MAIKNKITKPIINVITFYGNTITETPLPIQGNFLSVRFFSGNDKIEITFNESNGTIEVSGQFNLTIIPHSANVVTIGTKLPDSLIPF